MRSLLAASNGDLRQDFDSVDLRIVVSSVCEGDYDLARAVRGCRELLDDSFELTAGGCEDVERPIHLTGIVDLANDMDHSASGNK